MSYKHGPTIANSKPSKSALANGMTPLRPLVGWVYLSAEPGYTIRWKRGDQVAYVFAGKQLETYPDKPLTMPVLATIPVSSSGWTDLAQILLVAERWLRTRPEMRDR